ncbi:hypothetical protein BDN72DRAFT_830213 [Pluteus cervinus]|uniref:Uncharacterized protein n=1 Tax=Pluteus cervinus TaxID=181527 RepID=A0ACD3BGU2_9AGAR|nr:hypothetical protein BDN72DRAFT_830213 [Pluteus cervinus]
MFLRRGGDNEECPPNRTTCPHTFGILGPDPIEQETLNQQGNTSKPGVERYIGIIMVVVLFLLVCFLWGFIRWRRGGTLCCGYVNGRANDHEDVEAKAACTSPELPLQEVERGPSFRGKSPEVLICKAGKPYPCANGPLPEPVR